MQVNFEYYKTFCVVAESKSITEASKKLYISQPAITKTIKLLENILGFSLFERTNRGIILTEEGTKLYAHIKPLILQIDDTKNIMNDVLLDGKTNIRIGTSITVLKLFLLDYIKKYTAKYPNVHFYIKILI